MVSIERVTSEKGISINDINALVQQVRRRPEPEAAYATDSELVSITGNPDTMFIAAKDGNRVIGMALVFLMRKFAGTVGYVETVVVLDSYRGQGIGRKIMEALIAEARKAGVKALDLTSHAERVAANVLYQKLGFEKRETNVYRLKL